MKPNDKLFADFARVSKEQWKAKIVEDLKGADYEKKLVWKTDEGFAVQPFYNAEDRPSANLDIYTPSFPLGRKWTSYVEIKV
jgi:methylmalonyl-CoA mutase